MSSDFGDRKFSNKIADQRKINLPKEKSAEYCVHLPFKSRFVLRISSSRASSWLAASLMTWPPTLVSKSLSVLRRWGVKVLTPSWDRSCSCPASGRWPCLGWAPSSKNLRDGRSAPLLPPGPRGGSRCCLAVRRSSLELAAAPLTAVAASASAGAAADKSSS